MAKDLEERNSEPDLNLTAFLTDAYLHPIFHSFEEVELTEVRVDKNQTHVPITSVDGNNDHIPTPSSETSSPSPPHHYTDHYEDQPPHTIQQYEVEQQPYNVFHYGADSPSNVYRY